MPLLLLALGCLCLLAGTPLAYLLLQFLEQPSISPINPERLGSLAWNTGWLCAGTVALALPLGVFLALLLHRTELPGRTLLLPLLLSGLFIPLPVVASAWQVVLGVGGWVPFWSPRAGQPWSEGLTPAIWVHALAGLPWVVLLMGQALARVEPELEEEALLAAPAWRVLWSVTLPRCGGAILVAALWLVLQTASEIAVTDMFLVRTFAEEVYTIFNTAGPTALSEAIVVSLLPVVPLVILVLWLLHGVQRRWPPAITLPRNVRRFFLGRWRWPLFSLVLLWLLATAGVPLAALLSRVGLSGLPPRWSLSSAGQRMLTLWSADAAVLVQTLFTVLGSAVLTSTLALLLAGALLERPGLRFPCAAVLVLLWALPGPVVGIALKEVIQDLVRWKIPLLTQWLYFGPSPVPIFWAHLLRALPLATALLWLGVRQIPPAVREGAAVDGASPMRVFFVVVVPLTWRWWAVAVVLTGALALGEVSTSKLVETPGWETLVRVIFDRMHYGVAEDVAGLCLALLLVLGVVVVEGKVRWWALRRGRV